MMNRGLTCIKFFITTIFLALITFTTYSQGYQRQVDPLSYAEMTDPRLSIQLFPNPALDYLHIDLGRMKAENVKFSVHNIIGNEMVVNAEKIDEHTVRIRVKEMAPGYYFLAIKNEALRFKSAFKFVKD